MTTFPVLDSSFRYHAPTALLTASPAALTIAPSLAQTSVTEADNLASAVADPEISTSSLTTPVSGAHLTNSAKATSHPENNASSSNSDVFTESAGSDVPHGLDLGAKIGIIVSITVVVILTLIAVGFCLFDGRQRLQRLRERRKQRREADTNMWEAELQNGREHNRDSVGGGLWNGLRIDTEGLHDERDDDKKKVTIERYENSVGNAGMWERIGKTRNETKDGKAAEREERHEGDKLQEVLPAYMPRERLSIVSSVGSSVGATIPIAAMSPLDKGVVR